MKFFKITGILAGLILMCTACATPPVIQKPASAAGAIDRQGCELPFVKSPWQFVHSIKAVLPDGQRQTLLGTIFVYPALRQVHCVLMSIEGLVLLDMESGTQLTVNRAVPPFDSRSMQTGLLADIRLLFLSPEGDLIRTGMREDHLPVCRYQDSEGAVIDLIFPGDSTFQMERYDAFWGRERSVRATGITCRKKETGRELIPARLELTAHGVVGYKLTLDLIEALPIQSRERPE